MVECPNSGHEPDASAIAEAALTQTRKPTLVVPVEFGANEIKDKIEDWTVLVCWNRSAHAAAAASKALPILKRAKQVELLNILTDAKDGPSARDFAYYLDRHGVRASVKESELSARAVGAAMPDEGHSIEADLIVMGAFSYGRLRALILGGVTRYILDNPAIPVMLTR